MLIDISEVLLNTGIVKRYAISYGAGAFSCKSGDYPVIKSGPFSVEIVSTARNRLSISGSGELILSVPCGRCLKNVDTALNINFGYDVKLDTYDEEQNFVEGHNIETDRMIETEILLNMPARVLCSEECKGMCPVCGKSLNDGECGCDRFVPDPRMAAINDIFNNFSK